MGIELASSFDRKAGVPLDSLSRVANIAARDAIPALVRYVGMEVTVLDDGTGLQKKYWLKYGIDNADWSDDVGGGGSGSGVIQAADIAARDAIATDQRQEGLLVYVFSAGTEPKTFQLVGGISNAHWKEVATQDSTTTLKNKDIDGGTASNTSRLTTPRSATIEAAAALVRKKATLLYNDFTNKFLKDNGTDLKSIPDFGDVNIFAQEIAADNVIGSWTQNLSGITATFTKGTDSRLGTCYKLDITSAASGTGGTYTVRKDFSVPEDARGSYVELSYDYVSTVTKTGTCIILYDVTNSVVIVPQTDIQAQPDPTSLVTKGFITFSIPSTCATLRVFIGRAVDASAIAISNQYFYFNNLQLKKTFQNIGSPSTAVVNTGVTTWAAATTAPTKGTTVKDKVLMWREGQFACGIVEYQQSAAGSAGSGLYYLDIASNLAVIGASEIDTNLISTSTPSGTFDGGTSVGFASWTRSAALNAKGNVAVFSATRLSFHYVAGNVDGTAGTGPLSNSTTFFGYATGTFSCFFKVPIKGWSSTARYADYTLNQDVSFVGFRAASTAASPTVNVKVDSVKDTVGAWDAVNGEYEVKSAGDTDIEMTAQTSTSGGAFVYKNGTNTGYFIGASWGANGVISGSVTIPNCIVGDKLSIRLNASFNLTNTYLSFSKRATSQQLFTPIAQRYVVKTYQSGTSWYEVYNDGWVKQGDYINTGTDSSRATTLVIPMKDANYEPRTTIITTSNSSPTWEKVGFSAISSTQVTLWAGSVLTKKWSVEGYGNSAAVKALGSNPNY